MIFILYDMDLRSKLGNAFYGGMYNIAFLTPEDFVDIHKTSIENKAHWLDMNGYDNGWFADPFIYDVKDDVIEVLAEEYEYCKRKGRLSMLTIDRKSYKLISVDEIFSLDTHLSFPIIYREGDSVYIYPENSAGGFLKIYDFDYLNRRLVEKGVLVDKPLLDSQLVKIEDKYYVFALELSNANGENCTIEKIFSSSNLFGPYEKIQEISSVKNEVRGAGSFFYDNGKLFRPAQCCEGGYGRGVIFYEITFDGNSFNEVEVGRLYPNPNGKWTQQLHTYNSYKGWTVIDGYEYFHPVLNKIVSLVRPKNC